MLETAHARRSCLAGAVAACALLWTALAGAAIATQPEEQTTAPKPETGSAPESSTGSAPDSGPVDASVSAEVGAMQAGQAADHLAVNAGDLSSDDRRFVEMAMRAGNAEVESARLAGQNASSPDVRRIAQHLEMDHTRTNQELGMIASRNGVVAATDPPPDEQAAMDRLKKLTGAEFDQEYVRAQLVAHEKAIALFQQESTGGENAEVKTFAQKTLPRLRQHVAMLEETKSKVPTAAPAAAAPDTTR